MSASLIGEDECELELRDMVAETLENNGVLPKIRAQLRASVFLALDETAGGDASQRFHNSTLRRHASQASGRRCLALVRELLVCLQLDCTLSVLDAELDGVAGWREERSRLAERLGVSPVDGQPVLDAVLAGRDGSGRTGDGVGSSPPGSARSAMSQEEVSTRSAGSGRSVSSAASGGVLRNVENGGSEVSDEEDSFFDSLPKVKSVGAAAAGVVGREVTTPDQREPLARRSNGDLPPARSELLGELPPLGGRGTLPPLRGGQLPSLKTAADQGKSTSVEQEDDESVSEELASESLQSDGITEDVSLGDSALRADFMESL